MGDVVTVKRNFLTVIYTWKEGRGVLATVPTLTITHKIIKEAWVAVRMIR